MSAYASTRRLPQSWARGLTVVRALDARGVDGRAVAARAGIDVAALEDPDSRHSIADTTRLWRLAVEATHDPCFGLWASRFVTQTTFHALSFAVFASATLREAFGRFVRYGDLVSDAAQIELLAGERERFRLVLPEGPRRPADEAIDAILSLVARTARVLSEMKVTPVIVRLERPEPIPSAPFVKVFRAPVRFQERENVLEFAARDLDERLPAGNAELARHNDELVARYLARIERARVCRRLRSWLIDQLPAGEPTEEAAARSLGMNLRNLQRRLEEEGTSYPEALDETRRGIARSYLDEGHISVTEIAFLLGVADASGLSREPGVNPFVHLGRLGDSAFGAGLDHAHGEDTRRPAPLPEGVDCFAIGATRGRAVQRTNGGGEPGSSARARYRCRP